MPDAMPAENRLIMLLVSPDRHIHASGVQHPASTYYARCGWTLSAQRWMLTSGRADQVTCARCRRALERAAVTCR